MSHHEETTLESLWREEVSALRRFYLRRHGNVAEAEDAIGSLAVRVVEHYGTSIVDPRAWLWTIARHVSADLYRARARSPLVRADAAAAEEIRTPWNPEDAFLEHERRQSLLHGVGRLPRRLALLVRLRFVDEFNLREIATRTEMSEANVRRLLHEACGRLRRHLISPMR